MLLHGSHMDFFQSGNIEQTGKVREFYPKYWKNEESLPKILKNEIILAIFLFLFFL